MKVQDVMTEYVISVSPDDTIAHAIQLMLKEHVSGLPVLDKSGGLVGMVTEGDFLRRAETKTQRKRPRWLEFLVGPGRLADDYVHTHGRKISEVMTIDPITVTEDAPLEDAVTLMQKKGVKRLPVLRGDKVVGIVSRANLLSALASIAGEVAPTKADDKTIRDRIVAELKNEKWAPTGMIDVAVRDGVVSLSGTITDERERQALIVAAENVPGVRRVNDHIAWIEPMSGIVFEPENETSELPRRAS